MQCAAWSATAHAYSYGLYSYGLYSYGLCSYGLYSYGLPGNLKYLIRDYYLNKFKDGKKLFNEEEMLADLSPQLKTEARTRLAC